MARGEHLVRADRRFATGGGLIARLVAPAIGRVLDQIDPALEHGGIDVTLPDGSRRRLGFRAPGPSAVVYLRSWMALARLATSGSVGWYKAWALGEWSSPDPVEELADRGGDEARKQPAAGREAPVRAHQMVAAAGHDAGVMNSMGECRAGGESRAVRRRW